MAQKKKIDVYVVRFSTCKERKYYAELISREPKPSINGYEVVVIKGVRHTIHEISIELINKRVYYTSVYAFAFGFHAQSEIVEAIEELIMEEREC